MTFQLRVSSHILNFLSDSDLPDTALCGLEEGYDSEYLRILAGLGSSESPFKLVDYFERSLAELGISIPSKRKAFLSLLVDVANQVREGMIDAYCGFEKIDAYITKGPFYYHDFGLLDCYGIYLSIWETKKGGLQFHKATETAEQYIEQEKQALRAELATWLRETAGA